MNKSLLIAAAVAIALAACGKEEPKKPEAPAKPPVVKPEPSKVEEKKGEAPKTDAPKVEEKKGDAPKVEEKKTEEKK